LIFGTGIDVATIVKKTLLDQFVFTVFITSPLITTLYIWKESNFNRPQTITSLQVSFFREKLPAVTLIYIMPPAIQLPLFNLVLCFFVLLLSALNND
jgi:hypothetical protein